MHNEMIAAELTHLPEQWALHVFCFTYPWLKSHLILFALKANALLTSSSSPIATG